MLCSSSPQNTSGWQCMQRKLYYALFLKSSEYIRIAVYAEETILCSVIQVLIIHQDGSVCRGNYIMLCTQVLRIHQDSNVWRGTYIMLCTSSPHNTSGWQCMQRNHNPHTTSNYRYGETACWFSPSLHNVYRYACIIWCWLKGVWYVSPDYQRSACRYECHKIFFR